MRTAIVIPAATDLNRGDQALVWEASRLVLDAGLAESIQVIDTNISGGDGHAAQTKAEGFEPLPGLLKDPRRGKNDRKDRLHDRRISLLSLILTALVDFSIGVWVLFTARWPGLAQLLLNGEQKATFMALRNASVFVVKGGGFLHANGELRAPYYVWYQLFYINLAHRLGKPVIVLPNSFGPFLGWTVAWQMRRALSRCQFIAARESISASALSKIIRRPVPVFPDMGYYLRAASTARGKEICREANVPLTTRRCVAFTVRPWRFPGFDDAEGRYKRYLDAIGVLVRHASEQGFHPVLVAHVLGPSAHENDCLAIEELVERLADLDKSIVNTPGDCRDLKAVYGLMDLVVGTRFHSVIFAQGATVPAMAITYGGNKGRGIMGDLGLSDYEIPIEDVTAESLCAAFDRLARDANAVRQRLVRWQQEASSLRMQMIEKIGGPRARIERQAA